MGGRTSKPAPPPPPPKEIEEYIDVTDAIYEFPPEVKSRLVGKSEVKRYLADDPVMKWIATLPDEYDEDRPLHPFLDALNRLCRGADIGTSLIRGAIRGEISIRDPSALFFAFDEYGNIVGFSVTSIDPNHSDELYREVTCTGLRRKGYGKMLDAAVIAYARELGKVRIRLKPAGAASRAIHTAMGFRDVPLPPTSEDVPSRAVPNYMVKDVPPTGGRRLRRTRKRSFLRKNKQWTRRR